MGMYDHIHLKWLSRLLLLIPYHMRKTNFITQLIVKIKQTHYLSSLWPCLGMLDHTHLKQSTNICCFHGPLITSKLSTSHLKLLVRYSSLLKNPAFWLALRFFNHNWRTRFLPNMLFLQKVKKPLIISCWSEKACISEWIKFLLKPSFFRTFRALWVHLNFFSKKGIRYFSYFTMSNIME